MFFFKYIEIFKAMIIVMKISLNNKETDTKQY